MSLDIAGQSNRAKKASSDFKQEGEVSPFHEIGTRRFFAHNECPWASRLIRRGVVSFVRSQVERHQPSPDLVVPVAYTGFLLLPFTMLIAQSLDQFFPCWRDRKAWFLLARIHFEQ
jgi:hypothetical protein